jgi:MFS family permease
VVFGLQFVDRSFAPILPLYIAGSGMPIDRVPFVAGVLFAIVAATAAVGHRGCGYLLRRLSGRRVIAGSAVVAASSLLGFAFASSLPGWSVATAGFGFTIGLALTAVYTAAGASFPPHRRGTGFGVLTSASLAGMALSPIASGLLGSVDLRSVFLLNGVVVLGLGALVSRRMIDAPGQTESPATEDA